VWDRGGGIAGWCYRELREDAGGVGGLEEALQKLFRYTRWGGPLRVGERSSMSRGGLYGGVL
jgi:hypothetical protein